MHCKLRYLLCGVYFVFSSSSFASSGMGDVAIMDAINAQSSQVQQVGQLLTYLGQYLGFNISQPTCPQGSTSANCAPATSSNTLLNATNIASLLNNTYTSYLGALLTTPIATNDNINNLTATIWSNYSTPSNSSSSSSSITSPSVDASINQQPYQASPVAQINLDILGTTDPSYCTYYVKNSSSNVTPSQLEALNKSCPLLTGAEVMHAIAGTILPPKNAFSPTCIAPSIANYDPDVLLETLQFQSSTSNDSSTSSPTSNNGCPTSPSSNQLVSAQTYLQNLLARVKPALPTNSAYSQLYITATTQNDNPTKDQVEAQIEALYKLYNYKIQLSSYASQTAIGISNIYSIFSKRVAPTSSNSSGGGNNQSGGNNSQQSQALNEFTMATWRLNNQPTNNQQPWITQINNASPATVQKEMAILLAEINYQLYLSRQQQERLLFTQSALLLQNSQTSQPDPNFGSSSASGSDDATAGG